MQIYLYFGIEWLPISFPQKCYHEIVQSQPGCIIVIVQRCWGRYGEYCQVLRRLDYNIVQNIVLYIVLLYYSLSSENTSLTHRRVSPSLLTIYLYTGIPNKPLDCSLKIPRCHNLTVQQQQVCSLNTRTSCGQNINQTTQGIGESVLKPNLQRFTTKPRNVS